MSELRRRAAFWRNMEYSLDQMLEEVNSRMGDKWVEQGDEYFSGDLTKHLGNALNTVRKRYVQVLQSQIAEWREENNEDKTVGS